MLRNLGVFAMLLSLASAARFKHSKEVAESRGIGCSTLVDGAATRSSAWRRTNDCKCHEYSVIAGTGPECEDYLGKRYFPSSIPAGVCKCQRLSNECGTIIEGSVERESSWRQSSDCKCVDGWAVQGQSPKCEEFRGQRYFPKTLEKGACQCEAECASGVFLTITKTPTLGIVHVPLSEDVEDVPFASLTDRQGCAVDFSLDCDEGFPTVQTNLRCSDGALPSDRITFLHLAGGPMKDKWEVCSEEGDELKLLSPAIDQIWNTEMPSGTLVQGCLQLESAKKWPELDAVRGSFEEQKAALVARKTANGGCPLFRTAEDRVARANDFSGSWSIRQLQGWQEHRARKMKDGTSFWRKTANLFGLIWLKTGTGGNRTTAFGVFGDINCNEPTPFIDGIAKWTHADVAASTADPAQGRKYATASAPQTSSCFDSTLALFLNSGSPEHTQFRQLLDEAGFDQLQNEDLPAPTLPGGPPERTAQVPTEMQVGSVVLPLVMKGVWQQEASQEVLDFILPYLDLGKTCIFGEVAEGLGLVKSDKIMAIRDKNAEFGRQSPRGQKLEPLLEKYPAVKAQYARRLPVEGKAEDHAAKLLFNNLGTGVLFAGLLGTTDMTWKCVHYQWRDQAHVRMYRKDKAAYLHELMRYDGAVTSFTATSKGERLRLEGYDIDVPAGTYSQMTLATSNRDPHVFKDPDVFNPERPEMGEQLSWNGRLQHVIARNYTGAPRFCPGYHLSVKVAIQVCDYLTQNLSE